MLTCYEGQLKLKDWASIKRQPSTQRTQAPESVDTGRASRP
jgi:hypothetical protein